MSNGLPKQPTFRSIMLGIVLFVIVLVAFLRIPDVIKFSGAAVMFVPAKLGLIDMPMPKDVVPLPLDQNPSEITFTSPGQYMMYLNIYDLLYHEKLLISKAAVEELYRIVDATRPAESETRAATEGAA